MTVSPSHKSARARCWHLALACATLGMGGHAVAQTAVPAPAPEAAPAAASPLTFNVALTSDYRYRGIAQSRLKPAVSAGLDYAHPSGFYVGTWLTTIRWIKDAGGSAPMEWDVYGGYKGSIGTSGVGYDVGLLHYHYPRHRLDVSPNTTELYGALSYSVLTLKYSHALTNLFGFEGSRHSGYLELAASFDLGDGWSLAPHVGRQWVRHHGAYAYTDFALTVGKDFGQGLAASVALVGSNADKQLYTTPSGRFTGRTALVAGVKYTF
ncbi:MAG: TorF family putative porin [Pseudomonadota bacterium]|nr:TorF family putative porin [Pseudomonadota bacterium]